VEYSDAESEEYVYFRDSGADEHEERSLTHEDEETADSFDFYHDTTCGILPIGDRTGDYGDSEVLGEVSVRRLTARLEHANQQIVEEATGLTDSLQRLRNSLADVAGALKGTEVPDLVDNLHSARSAVDDATDLLDRVPRTAQAISQYVAHLRNEAPSPTVSKVPSAPSDIRHSSTETGPPGPTDGNHEDADEQLADVSTIIGLDTASDRTESGGEVDSGPVPSHDEWTPAVALRSLLPELAVIDDRAKVLLDESRTPQEHVAASRDIVGALHIGIRGLLVARPALTEALDSAFHQESEEYLRRVGKVIDAIVQEQNLSWPRSSTEEDSSAASDLIFLFRCASRWTSGVEHPAPGHLADRMRTVAEQSNLLLTRMGDKSVRQVACGLVANDDESPRSLLGALLSGAVLVISLIQGPGAAHDLPEDLRLFGGDLINLITGLAAGILWVLEQIWSLIDSLIGS
jgi:hypothetical protein